jgi:hypothetical protein
MVHRHTPPIALVLGAGLLFGACARDVQFKDDFALRFDLRGVGGADKLATPYVEGAPVRITVTGGRDVTILELTSTDPDVFRIDSASRSSDDVTLECTAVSAGTATIEAHTLDGKLVDTVSIAVGRPDRVELHGPSALSRVDGDDPIEAPAVLLGGEAAFEVRYFEGDTRLFGNDVLEIDVGSALTAWSDTSWLGENREWLHVVPEALCADDACALELSVGGRSLSAPAITVVEPTAIASVSLDAPDESAAEDEDSLTVVARAETATGERVYGVAFDWTHDTLAQTGEGDLFRYTFDSSRQALPLEATFDGMSATVDIRGQGSVASSTQTGCSTAPGLMGWFAVAVSVLLVRRSSVA